MRIMNARRRWVYGNILHDPILFTLVVDNFGVKYTNQGDLNHLIGSLK
jgi:hypothetical protein